MWEVVVVGAVCLVAGALIGGVAVYVERKHVAHITQVERNAIVHINDAHQRITDVEANVANKVQAIQKDVNDLKGAATSVVKDATK